MKQFNRTIIVIIFLSTYACNQADNFAVTIRPQWDDLEKTADRSERFGGKWIVAGKIQFKKMAKEPTTLKKIVLNWHGKPMENLCASLYRKEATKSFKPIERYLVCDGEWNKQAQALSLNFDRHVHLNTVSNFYLVLTVPNSVQETLKNGHFELSQNGIPAPFRDCLKRGSCSLSFEVP